MGITPIPGLGGPDTDPTTGLPIIRKTVTEVADQDTDPRLRARMEAAGMEDAGWWNSAWAALWASIWKAAGNIVSVAAESVDWFYAIIALFFKKAQAEDNPAFPYLTAGIIEDLTGVKVDAEKIAAARLGSGRLGAMNEVGKSMFNLLTNEFLSTAAQGETGEVPVAEGTGIGGLPTNPLSPEQGIDAAHRFLGFVMSYAIRQGNIDVLSEAVPMKMLQGFRGFGQNMARNLSLGRLVRMALRPLIDVTLATPLEWALMKQYRPTGLGPAEMMRAWWRDNATIEEVRESLARKGYSEKNIDRIIQDSGPLIPPGELIKYLFRGLTTENFVRKELAKQGYFEDRIVSLIETARPRLSNGEVIKAFFRGITDESTMRAELQHRGYLTEQIDALVELERPKLSDSELMHLLKNGEVDEEFVLEEFQKEGYSEQNAGLKLTARRIADHVAKRGMLKGARELSVPQLRAAFFDGVIDLGEFKDYLSFLGYEGDEAQILTIDAMLKFANNAQIAEAKQARLDAKAARDAAAAAKKAGTPPPQP
jgi:hypothetical protein